MSNNSLDEKKRKLVQDIEKLRVEQESKRAVNARKQKALVISGFALSIAAAVTGFVTAGTAGTAQVVPPIVPPILVILVGIPVGMERAFRYGEKKDFHRMLASECYNLEIALNYAVVDEDKFRIILEKFTSLINRAAKELPKGQGMNAVKSLYEELDSKGIVAVPANLLAQP